MAKETNIMRASNEWANRPDDQRFLSMEDLHKAVLRRKQESHAIVCNTEDAVVVGDDESYSVKCYLMDRDKQRHAVQTTNWSFNQLAQLAGAPPSYLRTLPPSILAQNLNWGFSQPAYRSTFMALNRQDKGYGEVIRGITSPSYGRIWDIEVVQAIENMNVNGQWKIPAASYATEDPKKATTLYASDRDVFIFLVDPDHDIEFDGKHYFRGFYAWNTEVGGATFGLCTFLYSRVCDNRIIWGATDIKELRIRHNSLAPSKFASEFSKSLQSYANEGTKLLTEGIQAAKNKQLKEAKNDETLVEWLRKKGLTKEQAEGSIAKATVEEGQIATLWDIVQGITAYARDIQWADQRVDLETTAGQLMKMVA